MKKYILLVLVMMMVSVAYTSYGYITSVSSCVGSSNYLNDSDVAMSGTWSSSNPAVVTVTPTGPHYCMYTCLSVGTAIISYVSGTIVATTSITVNPMPATIVGPASFCIGTSATFSDATPGGTWSPSSGEISISSAGVATSYNPGTYHINYQLSTGCYVSQTVTVNGIYVGYISAPTNLCVGSSTTLTDTTAGGTWSCSPSSVASINPTTGVLTGISAGTVLCTYFVTGSPCNGIRVDTIHIVGTSSVSLSGALSVVVGATTTLYPSVTGGIGSGTWSSSDPSVATVTSPLYFYNGLVSGVSPGTAVITYSTPGCSGSGVGTVSASAIVTVNALDGISGQVYAHELSHAEVWLIKYNPSTMQLSAVDSTIVPCNSDSCYYQFVGLSTDSFRVKASRVDTSTANYLPTYHTSSYYWHSADVIYHTAGTDDIHKHINMIAGTPSSGPGFIAGVVTAGANKGSSTGVPVSRIGLYLVDASSGATIKFARTNSSGYYSFSNIPIGTYNVFPDSLNYVTTPFTGIAITASGTSFSGASFTQHTISKTITPWATSVNTVNENPQRVSAFPTICDGSFVLHSTEPLEGQLGITVSKVTGDVVYKEVLSGRSANDIKIMLNTDLPNAMYIVTLQTEQEVFTNKIELLR